MEARDKERTGAFDYSKDAEIRPRQPDDKNFRNSRSAVTTSWGTFTFGLDLADFSEVSVSQ